MLKYLKLISALLIINFSSYGQSNAWSVVDTLKIERYATHIQVMMTNDSIGYYKFSSAASLSFQFHDVFKTTNDWDSIIRLRGASYRWIFTLRGIFNQRLIFTSDEYQTASSSEFHTGIFATDLNFSQSASKLSGDIPNSNLKQLYVYNDSISYFTYLNHNSGVESIYNTGNIHNSLFYNNWLVSLGNLKSSTNFYFTSASNGFIVLESPTNHQFIHRTTNYGKSWQKLSFDSTKNIFAIKSNDANHLFLATKNSEFYTSTDNGDSWSFQSSLPQLEVKDIEFFNNNGIVVGDSGQAFLTTDFGQTWFNINTNRGNDVIDLQVVNNGVFYLIEKNKSNDPYERNYIPILKIETPISSSLSEKTMSNDFEVYPNPTSEKLNVSLPINLLKTQYIIYDMSGNEVKSGNLYPVNVSDLKDNLYIINIISEAGTFSSKFIVK